MPTTLVSEEQVEQAFEKGGFTINERFEETGYLYFPTSAPWTRDNPEQGRVFWQIEAFEYPDTQEGDWQKILDEISGCVRDSISTNCSWGRPNDKQMEEIVEALRLYVVFVREKRGRIPKRILDARAERNRLREED